MRNVVVKKMTEQSSRRLCLLFIRGISTLNEASVAWGTVRYGLTERQIRTANMRENPGRIWSVSRLNLFVSVMVIMFVTGRLAVSMVNLVKVG